MTTEELINQYGYNIFYVLIIALVLILAIYILQGLLIYKYNKLITGKGTILGWIPLANIYMTGKLAINKTVGIILLVGSFFSTTIVGYVISVAYSVVFIILIVKYFQERSNSKTIVNNSTKEISNNTSKQHVIDYEIKTERL